MNYKLNAKGHIMRLHKRTYWELIILEMASLSPYHEYNKMLNVNMCVIQYTSTMWHTVKYVKINEIVCSSM